MEITLRVNTGKITVDSTTFLDLCPLCSRIEDHAHDVKLVGGVGEDAMDGLKLAPAARKIVVGLMQGRGA